MNEMPITNREAEALSSAAFVFAGYGIEFKLPWACSMDDLEAEQFRALINACRAYHGAMTEPDEPTTEELGHTTLDPLANTN